MSPQPSERREPIELSGQARPAGVDGHMPWRRYVDVTEIKLAGHPRELIVDLVAVDPFAD